MPPEKPNHHLTWEDVQTLQPGMQLLFEGKPVEVSIASDKSLGRYFIFRHLVEDSRHIISSRLILPTDTSSLVFFRDAEEAEEASYIASDVRHTADALLTM